MRQIPCALGGRAYLEVWPEEGALCVERLVVFHLPSLTPLFSILSNVKGAWLLGDGEAHGWVVRFCQPLVQSPFWSWLPIVEAL